MKYYPGKRAGAMIALALIAGAIVGCEALIATPTPEAPRVEYTVQTGTFTRSIEMIGNIEYEQAATLKWETSGVIGSVNVSVGDKVRKGDVLAELTTDSLSTTVLAAEKELITAMDTAANVMVSEVKKYQALATLSVDESTLKATKAAQEKLYYPRGTQQDLEMAYDSLTLAEQNYDYAKEDFRVVLDSYKSWGEDETRSTYFESYQQSYETLQSAYAKWKYLRQAPEAATLAFAQGAVASAQLKYDEILEEYNSYNVIPRAKDQRDADSAVDVARNTVEQRYIIAPFDGVIASVSAETDQVVTMQSEAFRLVDNSAYYLSVAVNEVDRDKLTVGQDVSIAIDVLPEKLYHGTIQQIDNAAVVSDSGIKFTAKIKLNEIDSAIKAGMTASVEIPTTTINDVLLVPVSAITTKNNVRTVERITANGIETVEITIGQINTFAAEVTNTALQVGDRLSIADIDDRFYTTTGITKPETQP